MAADLGNEAICRIVLGEYRIACERVEKSEPFSTEGRRARQRLRALWSTLRRLARDSGQEILQNGIEALIADAKAKIANLDSGGSVN